MGATQQISLTIPEALCKESKDYVKEYGYKNIQELILDLLRIKVILEKAQRYKALELSLEGQKGMTQKEALKWLKEL